MQRLWKLSLSHKTLYPIVVICGVGEKVGDKPDDSNTLSAVTNEILNFNNSSREQKRSKVV